MIKIIPSKGIHLGMIVKVDIKVVKAYNKLNPKYDKMGCAERWDMCEALINKK